MVMKQGVFFPCCGNYCPSKSRCFPLHVWGFETQYQVLVYFSLKPNQLELVFQDCKFIQKKFNISTYF